MDRAERAEILSHLRADAERIAGHFGLRYRDIVAEDPRTKSRYGVCYQDGLIKIRLNHARTGQPLKYSSLVDTLCHELAHLRHFDHSPEFQDFFFRLLGWARRQGIYRPGPIRGRGPEQPVEVQPLFAGPPRRNGVPVFPGDEQTDSSSLPWLSPTPSPAPKAPPAPARVDRPRRPEQLSLF